MTGFRQLLEHCGYRQFYLAFGDSNFRAPDWALGGRHLQGPLRALVALFLLQQPIPRKELHFLEPVFLRELLDAGVLRESGTRLVSNSFHLIFCRSHPLFCQISGQTTAYFGDDSLALATFQTPAAGGRVLDLCCGPGTQSFVAAQSAATVTGVEIRPETQRIAELNRRLNPSADRIHFICSSFEDFAQTCPDRFDRILFNPPLIPMVPGYRFSIAGDGGPDGLDITRRILQLYHSHLAPGGTFEFIGAGLGRGGRPAVCAQLEKIARRCGLAGRVQLLSQHPIKPFTPVFESCVLTLARDNNLELAEARRILHTHYARDGYDSYWLFFASLQKAPRSRAGQLARIDLTQSFWGGWFV